MKNYYYLFLMILAFAFNSCQKENNEEEVIIDWYPLEVTINLKNQKGENLANPQSQVFFAKNAKANFQGKDYQITYSLQKAYYAPTEFYITQEGENSKIVFGEIMGHREYDDDITITWGNGTKDIIHLKRKINRKKIDADNIWSYNGKSIGSENFINLEIIK